MIWNKAKILVIGLDGMSWSVLRPMMEAGYMPNLKKMAEEGSAGNLSSTIPASSGLAWPSFMTGKNPGKHGVFGFGRWRDGNSYDFDTISSADIKSKTIFHILSRQGLCVGAVNVPTTFPPFEVHGFMVGCGMIASGDADQLTYPKSLFESIAWPKDSYTLEVDYKAEKESIEAFIKKVLDSCREKKDLTLRLMREYPWQFLTVVFTETDRLLHFAWHALDKNHPRHQDVNAKWLKCCVYKFFQRLDAFIGELDQAAGKNTLTMVMSDHGFGAVEEAIGVNQILKRAGLLRARPSKEDNYLWIIQDRLRGCADRNLRLYRQAKKLIKKMVKSDRQDRPQQAEAKLRGQIKALKKIAASINWKKTKAFYLGGGGGSEAGILVNLRGRQPQGVVEPGKEYESVREQIINAFQGFKKSIGRENGELKIHKREDIYQGKQLEAAPDLVLQNNARFCFFPSTSRKSPLKPIQRISGFHRQEAMLIIRGEGIKPANRIKDAKIVDLAPTILHLLGQAVPEDMDGKVLSEAFTEN